MRDHSPMPFTFGIAAFVFCITAVHPFSTQAADKPVVKPTTAAGSALAAGSAEDSLQACLARIPKDATAGQRMIAEQSCRRDEGDRKPFQASGGR